MILSFVIWNILMLLIRGADKTKYASNEEEELLNLHLQLYRHHGGDIVSCDSDTGHREIPPNYRTPVPCCLPCPCLQSCSNNNVCCQELGLNTDSTSYFEARRRISTFTHVNQHTLRQRIESTTTRDEPQPIYRNRSVMDQHQGRQSDFGKNNSTEGVQSFREDDIPGKTTARTTLSSPPLATCNRPQVFNKPNFFIDSQAYIMVKFCFKGKTMVDKCDRLHFNTDISEMIPITSRLTGLTYLNRFCFMCNEGDVINKVVADVWDAVIVSYANGYKHRFVLQPNDLMDSIISWSVGYINIHFVPRTRHLAQPCEAYDITSCNQTGLWETYDANVEKLCHDGHSLPILHHINYDYNTRRFKNIACLYCNVGDNFNSGTSLTCSYVPLPRKHSYSQTLNLRLGDIDTGDDESREKLYTSYLERAILPISNSGVCQPGYIGLLGRCRRIICPRDHYESNNKCLPLYRSITGVDINVKIEISPSGAIPKILFSYVLNKLRKIVNDSLAKYVTLWSRNITVWYGPKQSKVRDKYYMFDIYLFNSSDTIDFGASVKEIRAFYNNLRTHDIIHVLDGDKIQIEINFNHRIVYKFKKYYDMSISGDGSLRVLEGRTMEDREDRPRMLVSNVNWCYRVPFEIFDELEMIGMEVFIIKSAGIVVYKHQYDIPNKRMTNLSYVCLDMFIHLIDIDRSNKPGDDLNTLEPITRGDNTFITLPVSVNISIIVGCLGLCLACAVYKIHYTSIISTVQSVIQASPDMEIVSDAGMTEDGTQHIEMAGKNLGLEVASADNDVSETELNSKDAPTSSCEHVRVM